MKKLKGTFNILGTEYKVYTDSPKDNKNLQSNDGYILPEKKEIILDENNTPVHMRHVITHEIVHGYLYESGLDVESWANNEEIVDWISIQLTKMYKSTLGIKELMTTLYNKKEAKNDG